VSHDRPEWFAPKRYGYGAGLPMSWQGWLVTVAFMVIAGAIVLALKDRPLAFIAAIVPPTLAFILVTARTTRGGWRWRWGKDD
jgi:hypothetical protein